VTRRNLLITAVVLLLVVNVAWRIYANWGLVTIHAEKQPLGKIIAKIERQGRVEISTDLPLETPVTMRVTKVPVSEALETLSTVTDARWRLNYFLASEKGVIQSAIQQIETGKKPDGWKMIYFPVPHLVADPEDAALDPRRGTWQAKSTSENNLAAYLEQAGRAVDAGFSFPENWNPAIQHPPKPGEIRKVLPKLAKSAKGRFEEVFLLTRSRMRDQNWSRGEEESADFDWIAERMKNQIAQLPPEERAEAAAEFEQQQAFWQRVRGLPREQRREVMRELAEDPVVQERMENREARRDFRSTPEQRLQRYKRYLERKQRMQNREP
jgi:hypothetical protein